MSPLQLFKSGKYCLPVLGLLFGACGDIAAYRATVNEAVYTTYCLDIEQTQAANHIKIGHGKLVLHEDMSFLILNDSLKYSNITGQWDICCPRSDFGNYIFKVKGLPEWKQADANLFVLIDQKQIRLFFTPCNNRPQRQER